MRYVAAKRIILLIAASTAVVGLAQLLYGQGKGSVISVSEEAREPARVSPSERDDPWSAEEVIEPDALARALLGETKPIVIQVGIVHLYRLGHIPGSKFAGPATSTEGLDMLKKVVQDIPRTSEIVYYCGCCPWKDCPNIRPAHKVLKEMGFKKIKILMEVNVVFAIK